jgi:aryl-alcohol dehydrogenase-like predicted oxidoreductase
LESRKTLKYAIDNGITIIDTSSHFRNGDSERLIGSVLGNIVTRQKLPQFAIVSKAGYVYQKHSNSTAAVQLRNDQFHCISPSFLEAELSTTLDRLGVDTIDSYLLNNPERLLMAKSGMDKQRVYNYIYEGLRHLEKEVERGRIRSYGIASNSIHKKEAQDHISLERILELHSSKNFKVVQFPLNIFERDALDGGLDGSPSLLDVISVLQVKCRNIIYSQ